MSLLVKEKKITPRKEMKIIIGQDLTFNQHGTVFKPQSNLFFFFFLLSSLLASEYFSTNGIFDHFVQHL